MFENILPGYGLEILQADACNRGAAVKADAIGEQQLERTQSGAAAEADANGEQ